MFPSATAKASSAVQPEKALRSSFSTVSETPTLLTPVQPVNAPLPTPVTPLSITTSRILSLYAFQSAAEPSFAVSGTSPLPLIVRTPLRVSDQLRPDSVPSASTSESFAPQTLQLPFPSSSCAALSSILPQPLHSCQWLSLSLLHSVPKSQLCLRKVIRSLSMPESSPPISVQRNGVPSNTALSSMLILKNAFLPILSTLAGILSSLTEAQELNASSPMVFTPLGMLVTVSALHPLNAPAPMLTTLSGMFTPVSPEQLSNSLSGSSVSPCGSAALTRLAQSEKAPVPIVLTDSGIVSVVKHIPAKAYAPMRSSVSGSTNEYAEQ